jgi:K+-transporting ATPase ATPase C chain
MKHVRPALVSFALLTIVTGVVYPLAVTAVAQVALPVAGERQPHPEGRQARRLGADRPAVRRPKYFWSRLSATSPVGYNGAASSGSNLGPLNDALVDAVKARIDALELPIRATRRRCRSTW